MNCGFYFTLIHATFNDLCNAIALLAAWTCYRPMEAVPTTEASDY